MKNYPADKIIETKDYDQFVFHGLQRKLEPSQIRKLTNKMQKRGFKKQYPIAVFRDGGKLRIVDGHHRFEVAKRLKIPLWFIIVNSEEGEDPGGGNIGKPWSLKNWVDHYAAKEFPDYQKLLSYVSNGIPLTAAAALLRGHSAGSNKTTDAISEGRFKIIDTKRIDSIVGLMREFQANPAVKSRCFIDAVSMCMWVSEFDVKQLRARLTANLLSLKKTATRDQMLEQLERIYNFHSVTKINLAWLAREAMDSRSAVKPKTEVLSFDADQRRKPNRRAV